MDNQLALNHNQEDTIDLAWLGGILDGEGSFNLHWKHDKTRRKPRAHVQIRMGNTNTEILSEYIRILNKFEIPFYQYTQQAQKHHKIATIICVNRISSVLKFCNLIFGFLRGKRGHCFFVKNFVESRLSRTSGKYNIEYNDNEIGWLNDLRKINKKGVRDCMLSEK